MSGKLRFIFEPKKKPYSDNNLMEAWGSIKLVHEKGELLKCILDLQWNVLEILEWFKNKRSFLLDTELNVYNPENKSIAELRDMAYNREFFFSEIEQYEFFEKVDKCFSPHFFHLRGTNTYVYYIGINNGEGEISYYNENDKVYEKHTFGMFDFINSTSDELVSFFRKSNFPFRL